MTARSAVGPILGLALLVAPEALAHTRSVSYSTWTLQGDDAIVRVKLSPLDHNAIQAAVDSADPAVVGEYLQEMQNAPRPWNETV